jgi:hypothetical protein
MSDAAAPPGWYPDPWTPSRRRYWTGSAWTYATTEAVPVDHPPPLDISILPDAARLPAPVVRQPAAPAAEATPGAPAPKRQKPVKWILAVVVGLLVGALGIFLTNNSSSDDPSPSDRAAEPGPTTARPSAPPTSAAPSIGSAAGNDPSADALADLVVTADDVPSTARVVVFPGGIGLNQPTLDLCNANYPSESRRTARIQDVVLDAQGVVVLSTEAVLYGDSGGTSQALAEVRDRVAACPPTPVRSPVDQSMSTTRVNPPPDTDWPQTPTVERVAFDLTIEEASAPPRHTIAVYLRRGRALLGVYFSRPDGAQITVEGQTTIQGIVGVFAARLAALPTSVVGA